MFENCVQNMDDDYLQFKQNEKHFVGVVEHFVGATNVSHNLVNCLKWFIRSDIKVKFVCLKINK